MNVSDQNFCTICTKVFANCADLRNHLTVVHKIELLTEKLTFDTEEGINHYINLLNLCKTNYRLYKRFFLSQILQIGKKVLRSSNVLCMLIAGMRDCRMALLYRILHVIDHMNSEATN